MKDRIDKQDLRKTVRERYGSLAKIVLEQARAVSCCGSVGTASCCGGGKDPITSDLYSGTEASDVPEAAVAASLGCGNPTALASLKEGEVVLDLGSGGGIDVLLAAKRVGPTGFVYGLDMTDEMLALAERNKAEAGIENVRFLKGHIEDIPLPNDSVDVVISNCVINLSPDKPQVIREAFRVLRPGGRFAVFDIVVDGDLPEAVRRDVEAYIGCVAGALEVSEYCRLLEEGGFSDVAIEPVRQYNAQDLPGVSCCGADFGGKVMSAFVRAVKPEASSQGVTA
ncbi:MAG: arsenite methyltransferase [Armatimonadota bacterium]